MHRSHALFGYKRPGLILLAIPTRRCRGYRHCIPPRANLLWSVSACFLRAMGTLLPVRCNHRCIQGPHLVFLYTRHSTLCPVDNMGESRGGRGSCKRIRVKTQGFRQPYTSSNVSASCPGVICRKSLYPRWDRSGSGWGRSLHSSCRTDRHRRRRAAGCRSPRIGREYNRSCGRPESPG